MRCSKIPMCPAAQSMQAEDSPAGMEHRSLNSICINFYLSYESYKTIYTICNLYNQYYILFYFQQMSRHGHPCLSSLLFHLPSKSALGDLWLKLGTQPHRLATHTETAVPPLDSALRSTGTNRAATAILAASPGRKGTTHNNRDSTKPVCATAIYQAVPNR